MREPVTFRAVVPRGALGGVRRTFVTRAREQLREQDREHEVARGLGMRAAAGGGAQGEDEQPGRAVRQPRVAPGM